MYFKENQPSNRPSSLSSLSSFLIHFGDANQHRRYCCRMMDGNHGDLVYDCLYNTAKSFFISISAVWLFSEGTSGCSLECCKWQWKSIDQNTTLITWAHRCNTEPSLLLRGRLQVARRSSPVTCSSRRTWKTLALFSALDSWCLPLHLWFWYIALISRRSSLFLGTVPLEMPYVQEHVSLSCIELDLYLF